MKEIKLEIKDYYVLLNLHKALLEAKFHNNPDNILVSSSPIIADLSNEVVDILTELDKNKDNGNVEKWNNWRKIEKQSFYRKRAINNAILNERWKEMSNEDKKRIAINLLSPFRATKEEIKQFINEVDKQL